MNNKWKLITILLVTIMILGTACGGGASEGSEASGEGDQSETGSPRVIKLGHMSPELENDPYHQFAMRFKEAIEEKTDGRFEIEVAGGGILGKDRELAESIQFGTLDLAVITSSPIGNFIPAFQTLDLPYLFRDWDHVMKFLKSPLVEELYTEGEDAGFITLGLIGRGFRNVTNSGKPIKSVEDLKGVKLRVIESEVFVDTFAALGAAPQAMSWSEVITALQQGTIDGHENSLATINNERVFEVQDNVTLTEHIFAFTTAFASKSFWETLSEEDQQLFRETARELTLQISEEQSVEEENFKKILQEEGMEIFEIDKAPMAEMVQPVHDKFIEKQGDKYVSGIKEIK